MFIRISRKKNRDTGKEYLSYQLMDSVRTEKGPRQRLILNLGSVLSLSETERKMLADRIEELQSGITNLIPYPEMVETLAHTYHDILSKKKFNNKEVKISDTHSQKNSDFQCVDLNSINHEQARSVGVEYTALETIKKLELDSKLSELGLTSRQVDVTLGVLISKLCHPGSELSALKWLKNNSGLDELIGTDFNRLSKDAVYGAADHLMKHKDALEKHLEIKERNLFSLNDTILLYDLTNTYFEGSLDKTSLAARGKSKEKRSDCPLVTLGLVLDSQGFAKRSRILPGNISEPKTLESAIEQLYDSHDKPIVVLDAGIATKDNLSFLKEQGFKYIVASRRRSCDLPSNLKLQSIHTSGNNNIKAAKVIEDNGDILLYCHSEARGKKEEAIRSLKQERLEKDLQSIEKAIQKGKSQSYEKILKRVGRLQERHSSIAHYYKIKVVPEKTQTYATSITWTVDKKSLNDKYQGLYLLKAHGFDMSSEQLWKIYIMLTKVEDSFRAMKSDLGLRPVHHQITRRIEGHLFLTVMAYHIMQAILYQLQKQNISIRWSTFRQTMSSQIRVTTTMRLKDGRTARVRSTTLPDSSQKDIYNALNISSSPGNKLKTFV